MSAESLASWWRLTKARRRLREAKAVCGAMPVGPFYDVSNEVSDDRYYRNVTEYHKAKAALKALEDST